MTLKDPVYGNARKAALLAVLVSSLGWLVYVIFFGLTLNDKTYRDRLNAAFFPHWLFLVLAPFVYVIIIIHLVLNGRFPAIQSIINVLAALLLLCGGGIIYTDWILYYVEYKYSTKYLFEFAGCALAVTGIVVYTLLKPCFKEPTAHQTSSSPQLQATNEGSKEASTEMKSVVVPLDVTPEQNTVVFSTAPKESLATSNAYIGVSPRKVALDHSNTHTPHVSQTNKPNEDLPMENPRTYTSLIPRQREEMPVYEETNNMASSPPPEDEDIYMNDEEHERYDSIMYEDVSDMNRDEQQEEYVEVGMGGAAEDIDEPEQQYEELKP